MARTTTTIIRTTRNSGGSRRRSGSSTRKRATSRSRSTSRAKPRKTRFTTTKQQRTAYKESANKTNYLPLLGLAGLLGLGAFLFVKNAGAQENVPPPGVNPVPGGGGVNPVPGGGGGPSPGGFVHPPAGTRATVNATVGIPAGATPGLNLRASPSPTGAFVGGSAQTAATANGTPITVVQSNVVEQGKTDANKERWWLVTRADGRQGYLRAVGPGATANAPYVWNVSFQGQQTATGFMQARTGQESPLPAPPGMVPSFGTPRFGGELLQVGDLVGIPISKMAAHLRPPEAPPNAIIVYRVEAPSRDNIRFTGRPYSWIADPSFLGEGQSAMGLLPRRNAIYEVVGKAVSVTRNGQEIALRPPPAISTSLGGFVHPPAGTSAVINVTAGIPVGATPGLNLRTSPSPNGAVLGSYPNGMPITVIQSNIVEQGKTAANKERWWQVQVGTTGRTGYLRAVGPGNSASAPYVWNVIFPGQQTATGFMQSAAYPDPYQALVMQRGLR